VTTIVTGASVPQVAYIKVADQSNNFLFSYGATYPNAQSLAVLPIGNNLLGAAKSNTSNANLINVATNLAND
jgi:hypothetical protein